MDNERHIPFGATGSREVTGRLAAGGLGARVRTPANCLGATAWLRRRCIETRARRRKTSSLRGDGSGAARREKTLSFVVAGVGAAAVVAGGAAVAGGDGFHSRLPESSRAAARRDC